MVLTRADDGEVLDPDTGCTRCDGVLVYLGEKDFHEGTRAWTLMPLGGLLTGGMKVEMWACASCGHVEFFMPIGKRAARATS